MDRPPPSPELMLPALRRLLRPLVRLAMRCGLTFPVVAELLRSLYVEVAEQEIGPGKRTDSRVSVMTGVHRKELRRLRTLPLDQPAPPRLTLNAHLIATWLSAPGYSGESGAPLPLPRLAGDGPSFERLVTSLTRDVRPRAVLEDWLAQGIAHVDAEDRVHLAASAFLPQPGREEQLFYFARNLADHADAAADNVLAAGSAPFLDRSVHYDRLTLDAAAALERLARGVAQAALLEVNRHAARLAAEDPAPGAPSRRVNFGIYLLARDDEPG